MLVTSHPLHSPQLLQASINPINLVHQEERHNNNTQKNVRPERDPSRRKNTQSSPLQEKSFVSYILLYVLLPLRHNWDPSPRPKPCSTMTKSSPQSLPQPFLGTNLLDFNSLEALFFLIEVDVKEKQKEKEEEALEKTKTKQKTNRKYKQKRTENRNREEKVGLTLGPQTFIPRTLASRGLAAPRVKKPTRAIALIRYKKTN